MQTFKSGQAVQSIQFSKLALAVDQVLSLPLVEELIRGEQAQRYQLEQQVDQLEQQVGEERQRAEQLAARLREMGVDPDSVK